MTVDKLLSSCIISKCYFINYFIICILLIIVSDVKQYGTDGHIINNNDENENIKILNDKNNGNNYNFNQIQQQHQDRNYSITTTFNKNSGSSIRGSISSNNINNNFNYDNNYDNGNTNNNINTRRRLMDINGSDFNWIDYLDYNSGDDVGASERR